jgi:hypothetical protein
MSDLVGIIDEKTKEEMRRLCSEFFKDMLKTNYTYEQCLEIAKNSNYLEVNCGEWNIDIPRKCLLPESIEKAERDHARLMFERQEYIKSKSLDVG